MLAYERVAHAAATRAGAVLRSRYREQHAVALKGEVDLVTEADRSAEAVVLETLARAFPRHGIVTEESPPRAGGDDHVWYVDPLDGTTNYAHGHPHFAVSIALARAGELVLGLVHDPMREETFTALRGHGARLNGAPVCVSTVGDPNAALLATGFPYDRRADPDFFLALWRTAIERTQGIRCSGSAALDLCYVACGRLDGFWEWKLRPWDTAAGRLVVEESGGRVTDFDGAAHRLDGDETAASNGRLHDALLAVIRDGRARLGRAAPRRAGT